METLGIGSNTSPVFETTPIHTGSWGTPDLGISESLKGQNDPITVSGGGDLSQYTNVPIIEAYKDRGWTDLNAINADMSAKGSTYQSIIGGQTFSNNSNPSSAPIPTNNVATNFDDVYSSMYPGWSRQEAYNDWVAKGRPSPAATGGQDAFNQFITKNPYSDITPGWNPADFENELNNIYNESMGHAAKQEQYAGQLKESNIADINQQFNTSQGTLDTSKGQSLGTLAGNTISARQQQEKALDAARRLYSELTQGYQQRYGGASSAGEAARALAGQEQQRQMGSTRQATSDALRQIDTQKLNVEENYKNSLLELQSKKESAVREANNNFQSAILSIEKDRATAGQEKALAKMNLLKEYKTELFNIKQQEAAFTANIQAMREQANIELDSYQKQLSASTGAGTSALSGLRSSTTTNPTSGLTIGGQKFDNVGQLMTGVKKDDLTNYLGQMGQSNKDLPVWMQ